MIPKPLKLKPGDTIFYPSAGVGVIESVEEVYLSGRMEKCFVIRIPETKMTVRVPKANVQKSGIRPLLDGRRIKELFKILAAKSGKKSDRRQLGRALQGNRAAHQYRLVPGTRRSGARPDPLEENHRSFV